MVHDWAPIATILLGELDVLFANQVAPSVHMFQEEQIFARDFLSSFCSSPVLRLLVAFNLPIIARVPHAIVAKAGHFLPLAERGGHA